MAGWCLTGDTLDGLGYQVERMSFPAGWIGLAHFFCNRRIKDATEVVGGHKDMFGLGGPD